MRRLLSAPPVVLSTGHLHPWVRHTKRDMMCRHESLFSWEMLHFLFLCSVSLNAACPSVQWTMWHLLVSLSHARRPDKYLHKCFWDLWFKCPVYGLKTSMGLWGQGMDQAGLQEDTGACTDLPKHWAPCQNRAALSSLSQLLLWLLISHLSLSLSLFKMLVTQACLQKWISLDTTYSSELSDNQDKNVIGTFLLQVGQLRKFGVGSRHCFDREELLRLCKSGEKKRQYC